MSNTNQVGLRAVLEATYGIVPAAPDLEELCFTGAPNLAFTPETVTSEKIRSDRQIDDLILVGALAGGDVPSELAYDVYDLLLQGAFFNTFQDRGNRRNNEAETQITAVDGAGSFTVTDEGDTILADDILRGEGFLLAANNAYHIAVGGSTNTSWDTATATAVETPPANAKLTVVGRRSAAGDIDAAVVPDSLTSTILDFETIGLQVGDWIKLDGFTTETQNNEFVRILAIAPNLLTLDVVPSGWAAATPAGAVDIYLPERLTNGALFRSYTLEEEFSDQTPVTFQYFRGMVVDTFTLNAAPQSVVTLQFGFSGKDAFFSENGNLASVPDQLPAVDAAGRVDLATTVTFPSVDVLNSSSNVGRIARGGNPIETENFVLDYSIEIANNLRQLNAVGFIGAVDIGVGSFDVSGNLTTYFDNADLARDVINNTETSVDVRFDDDSEHAILIDSPRIKYSEGAPEVPGKDDDVTIALTYQAIRDAAKGYTLGWFRFGGFQ
jgi:hypothetical protein